MLIVFGIVTLTVMYAFSLYNKQTIEKNTNEAMQVSENAIFELKNMRDFFSCPADPTLDKNDPNYAREQRDGAGNCVLPVAFRVPGMDINRNGAIDPEEQVLIGMVPFLSLMDPDNNPATNDGVFYSPISESHVVDGYRQRLLYAVTAGLTTAVGYDDTRGAIDVRDESARSILETEDLNGDGAFSPGEVDRNLNGQLDRSKYAHAVLLSYGEDGIGARAQNGAIIRNCPASRPVAIAPEIATDLDQTENCDPDGIFMSGLKNDKGHSYNDDRVEVLLSYNSDLWASEGDGSTKIMYNTNVGNVGIGTRTPEEQLEVEGPLITTEIQALNFCNEDGAEDCMPPDVLGGDGVSGNSASMQCPAGTVISGIEKNAVYRPADPDPSRIVNNCVPAFDFATLSGSSCKQGERLYGISSKTGLICK